MHTTVQTETLPPSSLDEGLQRFLTRHRIDSFGKVWFLLFLWQREGHAISRAFAPVATFSDAVTLDETIDELESVGLLLQQEDRCVLRKDAETENGLRSMRATYEDPLARQQLLSRLYQLSSRWDD